jgi:transaldolase
MAQNPNLAALSAADVSVWLDDLSRERLESGNLQDFIDTRSVVGVTTNPSIFQAALSQGHAYDAQIAEMAKQDTDVESAIRAHAAVGGFGRCRRSSLHGGRSTLGA